MLRVFVLGGFAVLCCLAVTRAQEAAKASKKYSLQYKFKAGETLYWEVSHKAKITSTAGGTTQVVETASDSVKVWRVEEVDAGGITLVHSVASVRMKHKISGREETEVELPCPEGKKIPLGYEGIAGDVGVPLTRIRMDNRGGVLEREDLRQRKRPSTSGYEGPLTLPLPGEPVPVGERWTKMHVLSAPRKDGTHKQVKVEQRFTLQAVRGNVASIYVESVILTPVREPEIKVHLVQSKTRGTVRFDLAAGRVIGQDLSLDEEIIGAPLGDASSMHYVMQFTEKYSPKPPATAEWRAVEKGDR